MRGSACDTPQTRRFLDRLDRSVRKRAWIRNTGKESSEPHLDPLAVKLVIESLDPGTQQGHPFLI